MKRIEVKLSLSVVAPLLDLMKAASDVLEAQIAAPITLDDIDADFREDWKAELLQGQHEELHALMGLFNSDFFVNGVVAFDEENAEVIVRACSALRLRLRRHDLKVLGDEQLESGAVDIERLPDALQKPFMCYVFLGTIQELIIQHLDAAILRGPQGDGEEGSGEDTGEDGDA
ncbi:MAG: hypothetical protein MUE42_09930 [Opitutaceae bacterium]|jgi:hypothetical protein|nr:hypothetical protein [Opitutaceae bacterium]